MNPFKVEWAAEVWLFGTGAVIATATDAHPVTAPLLALLAGNALGRIRERRKAWRASSGGGDR